MATRLGAPRSAAAPDQSDMAEAATRADLAIAMQLLRASNMKAVRLQLALVSNNRKAALEAIDGLIDLDSEIASFIADMPPVPVSVNELREIAGWIDEQRTAIASEKMVLVCGTKGPDMKEKGGDDEDDVTPAPANSDPVDNEVMHLDGYEIGSKRILAEIEEHAFDDPPAAPRSSRPFTVSAEVRRPIAALESDTHELQLTVADIDQRLRRIPGRTFLLMTVLGMQALLALLIVYGDAIRPLIPPLQF